MVAINEGHPLEGSPKNQFRITKMAATSPNVPSRAPAPVAMRSGAVVKEVRLERPRWNILDIEYLDVPSVRGGAWNSK